MEQKDCKCSFRSSKWGTENLTNICTKPHYDSFHFPDSNLLLHNVQISCGGNTSRVSGREDKHELSIVEY